MFLYLLLRAAAAKAHSVHPYDFIFVLVLGLFVMTVGLRFISARNSVMIGGLMTGIAYVITAYLENLGAVLFINGILVGKIFTSLITPLFTNALVIITLVIIHCIRISRGHRLKVVFLSLKIVVFFVFFHSK